MKDSSFSPINNMGKADTADTQGRPEKGVVPMLILRLFQVLNRPVQEQRKLGHFPDPVGLYYTEECRPFSHLHALGHRDTLFRNGSRYRPICQDNGGIGGKFGMTTGKPPSLFLPFSTPYVQPYILTETSVLLGLILLRRL